MRCAHQLLFLSLSLSLSCSLSFCRSFPWIPHWGISLVRIDGRARARGPLILCFCCCCFCCYCCRRVSTDSPFGAYSSDRRGKSDSPSFFYGILKEGPQRKLSYPSCQSSRYLEETMEVVGVDVIFINPKCDCPILPRFNVHSEKATLLELLVDSSNGY